MQLVLSWPIRLFVVAVLVFSLFVDGAGYVYRFANHYPLQGNVPGLPPNFGGWQLYFHKGLDLAGGTHIDYSLTNFPPGNTPPAGSNQPLPGTTNRATPSTATNPRSDA